MRSRAANRSFARAWLALGYAFLYVPIVALVVYSFNDSPVANVWRGFTLRWYAALVDDRELLAGLALSLKVALATACARISSSFTRPCSPSEQITRMLPGSSSAS